jgi:tRNA(Ile)-lysidine synthase
VPLELRRAGAPRGNVQAWARDYRYAAAHELEGDIATGHTATDQVETVLYRLAASPGRRALLGMAERNGRVIRPLLSVTREETTAYCMARKLTFRDDPSNYTSARGHLRDEIIPALQGLHPAAAENILRTLEILRDEAEVLDALVQEHLRDDLRTLPPALARLVLQRLADEAGGPSIASHADALLSLAAKGGTAHRDLPGGLRATSVYGRVTIGAAEVVVLGVPGRVRFGGGEITAESGAFEIADGTLAADALGELQIRTWRPGDRMRPLGLGGTKSLQDLFTDRKVPRAQRHALPVVLSDGEIAWIPGVATGERFRVTDTTAERVRFRWDP